jgi:Mn-containing catalase
MREGEPAVDDGDGNATVGLDPSEEAAVKAMASRLASDPTVDPKTGAELGAVSSPADAAKGGS